MDLLKEIEENNLDEIKLILERDPNIAGRRKNGILPLHEAIRRGSLDIVKLLLDNNPDVNDYEITVNSSTDGFTPLLCAISNNQKEIVDYLIMAKHKLNLDINAKGMNDNTPLHCAIQNNFEDICLQLLQNGADVHEKTALKFYSPIHDAVWLKNLNICNLLIQYNANINAVNRYNVTPLNLAAKQDCLDITTLLLNQGSIKINRATKNGNTALHDAAIHNSVNVCRLLALNNAKVNARNHKGLTPLHYAAKYGRTEICRILFANQAYVNIRARNKIAPLHQAAHYGHTDTVVVLLKNGANVHCRNDMGLIPLHLSCLTGFLSVCKILVANNSDINCCNSHGSTPLHEAIRRGNIDVCRFLVDLPNIKINIVNKYNFSPLRIAVGLGNLPICDLLINSGAIINAKMSGSQVMHLAAKQCNSNILRLLLDCGGYVNIRDKHGDTPLHHAVKSNQIDNVEALLRSDVNIHIKNKNGFSALDIALQRKYWSVLSLFHTNMPPV